MLAEDTNGSAHDEWLDLVRGLCAILVCAAHLRAEMFVPWAELREPSAALHAFYFGSGLGRQAVMVFFVWSGYFVGGSVLRQRDAFEWSPYLHQRLTRLWTGLVPAVALAACVAAAVKSPAAQVTCGPAEHASVVTGLGNLLFLQTIVVAPYRCNTALWSLANELWYYLAFPLCLEALGVVRTRSNARRAASWIACIGLGFALPSAMLIDYAVWLMGAAVAALPARATRQRGWLGPVAALLAFLASLAYTRAPGLERTIASFDLAVGLGAGCLLLGARDRAGLGSPPLRRLARWTSQMSYSLYLAHLPVLMLVIDAGLLGPRSVTVTGPKLLAYLVALLVLVGAGRGFWWLFERNTPAVRRFTRPLLEWVRP